MLIGRSFREKAKLIRPRALRPVAAPEPAGIRAAPRASAGARGAPFARCAAPSTPGAGPDGRAPRSISAGHGTEARPPRRSPLRTPPTCSLRPPRGARPRPGSRALRASPRRDDRCTSVEPRWSSTTATSSRSAPSRSIVRTKLCPVQPKSHDERTIQPRSTSRSPATSTVRMPTVAPARPTPRTARPSSRRRRSRSSSRRRARRGRPRCASRPRSRPPHLRDPPPPRPRPSMRPRAGRAPARRPPGRASSRPTPSGRARVRPETPRAARRRAGRPRR